MDLDSMRATSQLPCCPDCKIIARPNIFMFNDMSWLSVRTNSQKQRFDSFLADNGKKRIVVIEMGAGTTIPTIRWMSERIGSKKYARVIRINPTDPEIRNPHISFAAGALEGLKMIDYEMPL